jgi:quercetin 2,3-dioxygenase
MTKTETKPRTAAGAILAQRTREGDGVDIRRGFPNTQISEIDPFLLLDHMGPIDFRPGQTTGFPDHPHRGFETVTYLLDGQMEHRDSFGNHGSLEAGDVQWMTAGSGLVHSEMPGRDLIRQGGRLEGFQIWINLPKRDKMTPPRYQELKSSQIPRGRSADGQVEAMVIAGESLGVQAAIESHTPMLYLHLNLAPAATHTQVIPQSFDAFAYVIRGQGQFEGLRESQGEGRLVVFSHDGDEVVISNPGPKPLELLLLGGEPIDEPIARYGPFVMNTQDELRQAFDDFRKGKMGTISA